MTGTTALAVAAVCIAALAAGLAVAIVVRRSVRQGLARRRERLIQGDRPLLLMLVGDDEVDDELLERLAGLEQRRWNALEPTVVGLLGKVQGEARGALVSLLERRGATARAKARLRRHGAVGRAAAVELLGVVGDKSATRALLRRLQDRDADVRRVAARALGRFEAASSVRPLLRGLDVGPGLPVLVVAQALLRIGQAGWPALIETVRDGGVSQRCVAIDVLGLTGAVPAQAALLDALALDDDPEVRRRAAVALGRIGMPGSVAPLLDVTKGADAQAVRAAAVRALGELGDPAAVPVLLDTLGDRAHDVAHEAAGSLSRLGPAGVAALATAAAGDRGHAAVPHAREALALGRLRGTGPAEPVAVATPPAVPVPAALS